MVRPSQLAAARTAPDRTARTRQMADVMREQAAAHGSCDRQQLRAAGFTESEILVYADEARAILSGRPNAGRNVMSPGRREGLALVKIAQRIRRCHAQRQEASHG